MSDIQMIKDQINGLIAKGKELRIKESIFLKVQGVNEEIEKTSLERSETRGKLEDARKNKKDLMDKKNKAVAEAAGEISASMNEILPAGKAVFDCLDGLCIGWEIDGVKKPYNGLSGGEKQIFDTALAHVLDANIIVMECAELDSDHMQAALEDLAGLDKQVILSTCHVVDVVPESFVKIDLEEVAT